MCYLFQLTFLHHTGPRHWEHSLCGTAGQLGTRSFANPACASNMLHVLVVIIVRQKEGHIFIKMHYLCSELALLRTEKPPEGINDSASLKSLSPELEVCQRLRADTRRK